MRNWTLISRNVNNVLDFPRSIAQCIVSLNSYWQVPHSFQAKATKAARLLAFAGSSSKISKGPWNAFWKLMWVFRTMILQVYIIYIVLLLHLGCFTAIKTRFLFSSMRYPQPWGWRNLSRHHGLWDCRALGSHRKKEKHAPALLRYKGTTWSPTSICLHSRANKS